MRSPSPQDRIFVSAIPPKPGRRAYFDDACAHPGVTDRRPFRGSCPWPRRANAIPPHQPAAVPAVGSRGQTRNCIAMPRRQTVFGGAGKFAVIPCSGESFPVPATKIRCSDCAGNLRPARWNRCANRPSASARWAEKPQIPCYFPCCQGIRIKNPIARSRPTMRASL
jgi:hypothetical protein